MEVLFISTYNTTLASRGIRITHNAIKEIGRKLAEKHNTNFEFFRITKNDIEFMNSENYMYTNIKIKNILVVAEELDVSYKF